MISGGGFLLADKLFSHKAALFVLIIFFAHFSTAFSQQVTGLVLGKPMERSITGGENHAYTIDLEPNQFARIAIEQRGVDLVAHLLDADRNVVADFDVEPRTTGQEVVEFATSTKCSCSFTVEPRQKSAPAGKYDITVSEIRAATPNDFALDEARRSAAQSVKYWRAGDYDKALPAAEHSLEIREKLLGPENRDTGLALLLVANVYSDKPDYQKAESLYLRALATLQKALGEDHILNSLVLNNLGIMYKDMGLYPKAESTLKQALAIREKNLDPNHLMIAGVLNNLAIVSKLKGDTQTALSYYERSLAIREKALGPNHPDVATTLNNIANLYDDPAKAADLYFRALKIREASLGPDHIDVAQTLYNISQMYATAGDYAKAKPLGERALAIFEKAVGPEHPYTGYTLNLLAILNKDTGDLAKAEELYLRSIDIKIKTQGPYHPDLAGVYSNLANLYSLRGEIDKALDAQEKANSIFEYNAGLNLLAGSEKDKIGYLSIGASSEDQTISLNLGIGRNSVKATELAAESILRQKGRVLEAISDSLGGLRRRFNPTDQALLTKLSDTSTQLSNLVLGGPQNVSQADFIKKVKMLEADRDSLEDKISAESAGFYRQSKPVTLKEIQAAVPKDAALVEFAVYRPISPKTFEFAAEKQSDPTAVGKPRYVAYVISQASVKRADIGDAGEIDKMVDTFREALRDPKRSDVRQLARRLDEKLMRPVRSLTGGASRLLLSPDGELNLMPFEALVDEKDRYLVENYSISYLSSERDLLRMKIKRESRGEPLIVANPTFGEPDNSLIAKVDLSAKRDRRPSVTTTRSITDTYFAPLGATAQEARSIQAQFPGAKLLSGEQATETALKQANAPSILHLATHGFFLTEGEMSIGSGSQNRGANGTAKIENPLLRSGLAFAGANEHRESADDGILTALEASGLNLWGTKLVVLSACDTGLGEVHTGEGVYGLRRSFQLAGAESLVMSLWPVSDYVTRELMTGYYQNLKQGIGRSESLRRIQLEMLRKPATRHPFYWASFIESGDWTPLGVE